MEKVWPLQISNLPQQIYKTWKIRARGWVVWRAKDWLQINKWDAVLFLSIFHGFLCSGFGKGIGSRVSIARKPRILNSSWVVWMECEWKEWWWEWGRMLGQNGHLTWAFGLGTPACFKQCSVVGRWTLDVRVGAPSSLFYFLANLYAIFVLDLEVLYYRHFHWGGEKCIKFYFSSICYMKHV